MLAWRRGWQGAVALGLVLLGCGDGDRPGDEAAPPGVRHVASFSLPTRSAVSRSTLELTDPFPELRFDDAVQLTELNGRFYVAERGGRIYSFDPHADPSEKTLVLDLSGQVIGARDSGLLAFAFHPEYGQPGSPNRDYLYVYYAYKQDPPAEEDITTNRIAHDLTLARFNLPVGEQVADPSSELVLLSQRDEHLWHQGGGLLFNPTDGFLYLSIGDEGGYDCGFKTCQRNDALFGGVLRIDVDMRGGEISHPIRNQPPEGVTDHYYIPNDNPFVDDPAAMEEMFAIGLRNPYRMTYDAVDDLTWIGDVGQSQQDEIDVLKAGGNYQWDTLEGSLPAEMPSDPTRPQLGLWTDPVHAYKRADMRAIVMGPVYRGSALPSLYGKLLHADFVRGNVWAASYAIEDGEVAITDTEIVVSTPFADAEGGTTSFMVASDGAVYLTTYSKGRPIYRIEEAPIVAEDVPATLSQTQLFEDLEALEPAQGLLEYEINTPLWSDGSRKRRFVAIPEGERATYQEHEAWQLPEGTVLVKHFAIALDERTPEALHKLETRVLVVERDGVYGATYRWREDQSDADLLLDHDEEELTILGEDGEPRTQTHIYPSPSECVRCHHPSTGEALGLSTAQLNRDVDGHNQLRTLRELELVSDLPSVGDDDDENGDEDDEDEALAELPRMVALDDESAPLEHRVRSYLDANCSFCHDGAFHGASWDGRLETPLEDAKIVDAPLFGSDGEDTEDPLRVIARGEPQHSQIYLRTQTHDRDLRMPPLGSARPDEAFGEVLAAWIESLSSED